jgi:probable 2-oxoglutarate dehydrogenase E1 component DHKTD1
MLQGVVAETFCIAECPHYNVGGSVHLIVNNQIGFTTESNRGRLELFLSVFISFFLCPRHDVAAGI